MGLLYSLIPLIFPIECKVSRGGTFIFPNTFVNLPNWSCSVHLPTRCHLHSWHCQQLDRASSEIGTIHPGSRCSPYGSGKRSHQRNGTASTHCCIGLKRLVLWSSPTCKILLSSLWHQHAEKPCEERLGHWQLQSPPERWSIATCESGRHCNWLRSCSLRFWPLEKYPRAHRLHSGTNLSALHC